MPVEVHATHREPWVGRGRDHRHQVTILDAAGFAVVIDPHQPVVIDESVESAARSLDGSSSTRSSARRGMSSRISTTRSVCPHGHLDG